MKITDQMIEEAARALQLRVSNRSRLGRTWEQIPESIRKQFRAEAKAALRAALKEDAFA
jgi:hypothetical protein